MKQIAYLLACCCVGVGVARAAVPVWTGAEDNYWTNRANWADGVVPGMVLQADPDDPTKSDGSEWTRTLTACDATFGTLEGVTEPVAINLDGLFAISNITFTGTTKYVFGTAEQKLNFYVGAKVTVNASAVPPTFVAAVSPNCGQTTKHAAGALTFENNNTTETFTFGDIGPQAADPNAKHDYYAFSFNLKGSGAYLVTGGFQSGSATCKNFNFYSSALTLTEDWKNTKQFFWQNPCVFTIPEGKTFSMHSTLGGRKHGCYATGTGAVLTGGGTYQMGAAADGSHGALDFDAGGTLCVECLFKDSATKTGVWLTGQGNLALLNTGNVIEGPITIRPGSSKAGEARTFTLAAPYIGGGAEAPTVLGNAALSFAGRTTLKYTGAGETTTRAITEVAVTGSKENVLTLEQAGTGAWNMSGSITPPTETYGLTCALAGDAAAEATLGSVLADGAGGATALKKSGSGTWLVTGENTFTGGTTISGGTLAIADGAALGTGTLTFAGGTLEVRGAEAGETKTVTLPGVALASGANTLRATGKVNVIITALARTEGATLDIVTEGGATVTCTDATYGAATSAPIWLTYAGDRASWGANGQIEESTYPEATATTARGGTVPNDATKDVAFATDGTAEGGAATLAATETTVQTIVQKAAADTTIEIGSGETLKASGLVRLADAGALSISNTVGGGTFAPQAATEGYFLVDNRDDEKPIDVATISAANDLTVRKIGTGTLTMPLDYNWTGNLAVDEGTVIAKPTLGSRTKNKVDFTTAVVRAALSGTGTFVLDLDGMGSSIIYPDKEQYNFKGCYEVRHGVLSAHAYLASSYSFGCGTNDVRIGENAMLNIQAGTFSGNTGYDYHLAGGRTVGKREISIYGASGSVPRYLSRLTLERDATIQMDSKTLEISQYQDRLARIDLAGHNLFLCGDGDFQLRNGAAVGGGTLTVAEGGGLRIAEEFDLGTTKVAVSNNMTVTLAQSTRDQAGSTFEVAGATAVLAGAGGRTANNRTTNVWAGAVNVPEGRTLYVGSQEKAYTNAVYVTGKISGAGNVAYGPNGSGKCRNLAVLGNAANDWTGTLTVKGEPSGALEATYPGAIPNVAKTTIESGLLAADPAQWTGEQMMDFINAVTFGTNGYFAVKAAADDETAAELDLKDVTATGVGVAVTGGGELRVKGATDATKPVRVAAYDGTVTITGDGTDKAFQLAGLSVGGWRKAEDWKNNETRVRIDGVNVENAGTQPLYVGENVSGGIKCAGRLEVANGSLVTKGLESSMAGSYVGAYDRAIAVGAQGPGILDVQDGGAVTGRVVFSGAAKATGAAWVRTGGKLKLCMDGNKNYGIMNNAYSGNACLGVYGGALTVWGSAAFSRWGVTTIETMGGTVQFAGKSGGTDGGSFDLPYGGWAHWYAGAGSQIDFQGCSLLIADATGTGTLTLTGEGTKLSTYYSYGVTLEACPNYTATATVNVNDGATLRASKLGRTYALNNIKNPNSVFARANFNGGVFEASKKDFTLFGTTLPTDETQRLASVPPVDVHVYGGGMTVRVDLTANQGVAIRNEIAQATGHGVKSIPVPAALVTKKLAGAPQVTISGGSGKGATAFAQFDPETMVITNVAVTSAGWNYQAEDVVTATFTYENSAVATETVTLAENAAGSFTKDGEGQLNLYEANTYGGDTILKQGLLNVRKEGAIPAGSTVVFQGGTLALTPVSGDSTPLTWPTSYAVDWAAGTAEYPGAFAFPAGATLAIRNLDVTTLEQTKKNQDVLTFTGEVTGKPVATGVDNPLWSLVWKGNTLRLKRHNATCVIIR